MIVKDMIDEEKVDTEMVCKDKFPKELHALAIDDTPVCLMLIETLLKRCKYKVTKTTKAIDALNLLRENKNNFDIVLTDVKHVHVDDMDGFKLLETIGLEMDIPVIMISAVDDHHTVRKGIEHGACDYLVKPVKLTDIQNIWKHVVKKSKLGKNNLNVENGAADGSTKQKKRNSSQMNENENDNDKETNSDEQFSAPKKQRFNWSHVLHKRFISAYDKLGQDKAVPSKLLVEMNDVPGLTREIIASHLQKYRNGLKKTSGQKSNNTIASSGISGQLSNASVLTFDKQGQNHVNCFNGMRANVYGSSQVQFGHHSQNRDALSHSFVNSKSHLLQHNHQEILSRQYSPNIVGENRQRMQVRELSDIASNSIMMENLHHQTYLNGLNSQSFSSRSRLYNGYMEMPSKVPDYNPSRESRSSNFQYGCTSNSFPIHNSFDFAGYPMIDDAISSKLSTVVQNNSRIAAVQNFLPGQKEERNVILSNMESSNMEHSMRIDQIPSVEHPFDLPETDNIYQLSSCSSTDDDLSAVIKQMPQPQHGVEALIEPSYLN